MFLDSSFLLREDELYLIMQLPPKHELCCFIRRSGAISGSLYLNSALELVGKSNVKVFLGDPDRQSGRERESHTNISLMKLDIACRGFEDRNSFEIKFGWYSSSWRSEMKMGE